MARATATRRFKLMIQSPISEGPKLKSYRRWSDSERLLLRDVYSSSEKGVVRNKFPGRSWTSIAHEALRLGLSRPCIERAMPQVDDAVLGYMAGFFDGEGSISIACHRQRRKGAEYNYYLVSISCGNNHKGPLELFQRVFGGTILSRVPKYGRCRFYTWDAQAVLAVRALESLLPFLRVKEDQATAAIEFQRQVHPKKAVASNSSALGCCMSFKSRVEALNRRYNGRNKPA